jgi:hypothetical protein
MWLESIIRLRFLSLGRDRDNGTDPGGAAGGNVAGYE